MHLDPRNMYPRYDVFRCLTTSNNCRCVLARSNTSWLDMCPVQEIFKSLLNVHISKASVLLRHLSWMVRFLLLYWPHVASDNLRLRGIFCRGRYLSNLAKAVLATVVLISTPRSLSHLSLSVEPRYLNLFVLSIGLDRSCRESRCGWWLTHELGFTNVNAKAIFFSHYDDSLQLLDIFS